MAKKKNSRNKNNAIQNVVCNSAQHGLIPQNDFFDKEIANNLNTDKYSVIEFGDFVYNPRISNAAPYGPINVYRGMEKGVVSPLYFVFTVSGIDKTFLLYRFQSPCWYRFMYLNGDSGARSDRVSIRDDVFLSQSLFVPKEEEQRKIGQFFELLDRRIAVQNKIIEDLECLRNGLVHLLNNDGTCETKTIGEVFEISKEKLGSNMDMPVFTASAKNGLVDEETYFKKKISGADKTNYQIIRKGDFVYSKSSSKDAPFGALIKFTGVIGLVSPLYWVLKPKKLINEGALEAWFFSSHASSQFQRKCQEGARNHGMLNIALADFLSIRLWADIPARIKDARHLLKKKIDRENKLLNAYQKEKVFLLNAMFI